MAADPPPKAPAAGAAPATAAASAKPKISRKMIIIVAAAVVAIGGGIGLWLALKPGAPAAGSAANTDQSADTSDKPAGPHTPANYYKFDPAFVVNFGGDGNARFLQVTVEAMSRQPEMMETLKNNEPAMRNDLVLLFSSQESATLMTLEGKEKLRAAALDTIRKVLDTEGASGKSVEAVYFTSFVIQ